MNVIDVKDTLSLGTMTAREINIMKGDTLISKNPNIKEQAMRRLQAVQEFKGMLQREINYAGTQDMPQDTVEKYEAVWIMLNDIAQAEGKTALGA